MDSNHNHHLDVIIYQNNAQGILSFHNNNNNKSSHNDEEEKQNQDSGSVLSEDNSILLPRKIIPETILVYTDSDDGVRRLLSYDFRPADDPLHTIGSKLIVSKGGNTYEGMMLTIDHDSVTLYDENDRSTLTKIIKYDDISVEHVNIEPTLFIDSIPDGQYKISFLLGSLTWRCTYSGLVIGDRISTIAANANIMNNTEQEIDPSSISIVAGNLKHSFLAKKRKSQYQLECSSVGKKDYLTDCSGGPMNNMGAKDTMGLRSNESETLSEYEIFSMSNDSIPRGLCIRSLFSLDNVEKQKKIFYYNIDDDNLSFGYRFETPRYLPDGSISMFDEHNVYLGSTDIPSTIKGGVVDLRVGIPNAVSIVTHKIHVTDQERKEEEKIPGQEIISDKKRNIRQCSTRYIIAVLNRTKRKISVLFEAKTEGYETKTSIEPTRRCGEIVEWEREIEGESFVFELTLSLIGKTPRI